MPERPRPEGAALGWDVIAGEDFLSLLRRAHAGENPDLLYAELYANADREEQEWPL